MDNAFKKAYNRGMQAYHIGLLLDDNPYKPSGHVIDTTFVDECYNQWHLGWWIAEAQTTD